MCTEADVPCYRKTNRQGSRCAPLKYVPHRGLRLEPSKAGEVGGWEETKRQPSFLPSGV